MKLSKRLIRTGFFALSVSIFLASGAVESRVAFADEPTAIEEQEVAEAKAPLPQEKWSQEVKTKYSLTDAQMKSLETAGLHGPQLAITAELVKQSGKTIDEVIQMRTTEKMGWGAIAKKLGLPPSTIGKSVSSLRHDLKEKNNEKRDEKRDEKQEERKAAREERKKQREERRQERRELRQQNSKKPN